MYIDYEISDDISGSQTLLSDSNLRFPLFDYYLQHWLIQKSFSVSGRHVVYYCPDICGLIVGEPIWGHLKGPAKRMADDDVRFAESFEKMIRKALDKGGILCQVLILDTSIRTIKETMAKRNYREQIICSGFIKWNA